MFWKSSWLTLLPRAPPFDGACARGIFAAPASTQTRSQKTKTSRNGSIAISVLESGWWTNLLPLWAHRPGSNAAGDSRYSTQFGRQSTIPFSRLEFRPIDVYVTAENTEMHARVILLPCGMDAPTSLYKMSLWQMVSCFLFWVPQSYNLCTLERWIDEWWPILSMLQPQLSTNAFRSWRLGFFFFSPRYLMSLYLFYIIIQIHWGLQTIIMRANYLGRLSI